jgi:hypothetical protein
VSEAERHVRFALRGRLLYDTAVGSVDAIKARVPRSQSASGMQSIFTFCEGLRGVRGACASRTSRP